MALNNNGMADNFVMLDVLDILDALHGSKVNVTRVCTSTNAHYKMAEMIRNDTKGYRMASLMAAKKAFLQYGKDDMIIDYWEHSFPKTIRSRK